MKSKLLISLLTASLAMNIGIAAMFGQKLFQARTSTTQRYCPFSSDDNPLYKLLNLKSDQLEAIESIAGDFHQKIEKLSMAVQQKRTAMMSMMERDDIDYQTVNAERNDIWQLQSAIQQIVFEHILQMKKILTPEQRKIFFQTMRQGFVQQALTCGQ
ncbi:Spy/CpxP family protein refolding chaperone [Solidesulfovibrio alcoholivorans]|uniref:Spy/CpxP family protein refolding chaperone n=1 Tax=Solidesulfovibrio alcoholivorans TaxID=81406 RepID=UPI000497909A|nr:periplasmic heavy metal sensor [Solidesulfovibrio alcoholivorans]